ncbi:hypothetical protein PDE_08449 [Penicillium oxalicum 114-2]|uniref:Uncharacterized protein n=2 Tax=Penicillium oxalicum TaxID=69781 RepID=S8BEK0_PENO1|nr:hypothetical protein PDE_08449 [Penicillium oxalicum 114-2]
MDQILTLQQKGMTAFRSRTFMTSRPTGWLRVLIVVAGLFALIESVSRLSGHSALTPGWDSLSHPPVLRPGQYRQPVNHNSPTENAAPAPDVAADDMGNAHNVRDENFYVGGTRTLTSSQSPEGKHPLPVIYDPYPDYNSREWKKKYHGAFKPCMGPRGRDLDRTRPEDMMLVYKGNQISFPDPKFGSHEAMGLDRDVCTDRFSRFGAYGYGADNDDEIPGFQRPEPVQWDNVDWNALQNQCFERNADRYKPHGTASPAARGPLAFESTPSSHPADNAESADTGMKQYHARSAVLIRSWHSMLWTPNHREYLRAMIMELSLHSGGEYEVFLLVHVKDDALPLFSDPQTVHDLRETIPPEFRNMALFFNTKLLEAWYPKIEEHTPVLQHHQPIQIFAQLYPQFDYYWQFEMDGRHTGNVYQFLDKAISFAREQPRKYLWERNAYFYTPGAHGPWQEFMDMTNHSLEGLSKNTVWGPVLGTGIRPLGPEPPTQSPDEDNFSWGVGEEADMITFLPVFNPKETTWTFPDKIWNFKNGLETPRRAAVITMGRYSKRLLGLMHQAQATRGLGLASEMSGVSWCLFHGLKAVHVPHPIYADGQWTPQELARIYNRGSPDNINGGHDSIWNWDHLYDHIMYRLSYMFTTFTAEDLYRRWLGYKTTDNKGSTKASEAQYGRHCFPSMFLHTIKNTEYRFGPDKAVP